MCIINVELFPHSLVRWACRVNCMSAAHAPRSALSVNHRPLLLRSFCSHGGQPGHGGGAQLRWDCGEDARDGDELREGAMAALQILRKLDIEQNTDRYICRVNGYSFIAVRSCMRMINGACLSLRRTVLKCRCTRIQTCPEKCKRTNVDRSVYACIVK